MSCAAEGARAGGARAHMTFICTDDVVTRCGRLIEDHDDLRRVGAMIQTRQDIAAPYHIQGRAEVANHTA